MDNGFSTFFTHIKPLHHHNIIRGWRLFSSHTKFDLIDGSKVRFWDDLWCGEMSLKEAFPILYKIASVKDASMADNMDFSNGFPSEEC